MGKKIFVTYKYADDMVRQIPGVNSTTVRDYVDLLQAKLAPDHIYKGEDDGQDISTLADSTIGSKLGDKIFDSTVTIVLISKGMKENKPETDQWIPWEISYSLREQSRNGQNSKTNALLAVIIPDSLGASDYYWEPNAACNSITYMTNNMFTIIAKNMFNKKNPETKECNGKTIHTGYFSYIHSVGWDEFIKDIDKYVDIAVNIWRVRNEYEIRKSV